METRRIRPISTKKSAGELTMKKFLLATVAVVALGATVPALAADLGAAPRYTKAPAYADLTKKSAGELTMKKFLLATVAVVALGATVPALAADLGAAPRYTKAPAY